MPIRFDATPDIRLYVVYHRDLELPDIPSLNFLRSDTAQGENIAPLANYCELRAHYYVWKNVKSDYVGFFHYRRYLEFDSGKLVRLPARKRPKPYRIQRMPEGGSYASDKIAPIVSDYDAIAPVWEYTGISVRDRYAMANGHRASDLRLIEKIIAEKYPEYYAAAENYLSGKGEYFGNIYIMKWECFDKYCRWLFAILEQFDLRAETPLPKTDGFLAERLFGIYFTWMNHMPQIDSAELPRLHFYGYDDERHKFSFFRFINFLLPPASGVRAALRVLKHHIFLKGC